MFQKLINFLFADVVDGVRMAVGGLLKHVEDARDFKYSHLVGLTSPYVPLHGHLELPTLSTKNQGTFNDCVFNSLTTQREVEEQKVLSVKSVVCYARQKSLLHADGLSDLRNGQNAGVQFGIAEESVLPDVKTDWDSYSSPLNLSPEVLASAAQNKAKTYFLVDVKDAWLKALDDGHAIHAGLDWFSSYNMGGGFAPPWVLPWNKGIRVGGHAAACIGYDIPNQLLIFKNSFGPSWGDNGKFYVKFSDWFRYPVNAGFVSVVLTPEDLAKFAQAYEGKQVKSANSPVIYLIQNGQKRPFPDEITFYAFGGVLGEGQTWQLVAGSLLDKIPQGEPMQIEASPYWNVLKDNWNVIRWLRQPENFDEIQKAIKNSL